MVGEWQGLFAWILHLIVLPFSLSLSLQAELSWEFKTSTANAFLFTYYYSLPCQWFFFCSLNHSYQTLLITVSGVRKEDFHSKTLLPFHGNSCPTNNNYHYQRPPISGRQGGRSGEHGQVEELQCLRFKRKNSARRSLIQTTDSNLLVPSQSLQFLDWARKLCKLFLNFAPGQNKFKFASQ